ncbi:YciI family protein [Phenylobacterium sp. J426]|uniref:YciI family protein n=1 Tax=Phenylobacterium sp. J426 TaxID=2898439 RepID=UPI002151C265|nr:YciI family protein [Phenylobacterium sp. J426]MCR5874630.1 YciI family protein [Phenylobacterium sp. J426]
MRVMVIVKANPDSEAGKMPSPEMLAEMDRYNDQLIAAGVMVDGAGLRPLKDSVRISFDGPEPVVLDGPFTETKELIAGYWIWQVKDLDDAVAWLKKAPFQEGEFDIRPFFEPEDFAGVASDELIQKEIGWREKQLKAVEVAS